ncbi:MAG: hypothetical protein FIA92_05145 [Chloroflexi bacterium]|nr:hypothetical protein [Chloroflexota bacterium]
MTSERDAYAVLDVDPGAAGWAVRAAYRALARRYHPDGFEPDVRRMTEINRAYDQLRTEDRRRAYDRCRRLVAVGPGPAVARGPGARPGQAFAAEAPVALGGLAGRIAQAERDASPVIDFGQYAGWRISDVARLDPNYLRWLSRHSAGVRYAAAIAQALGGNVGRRAAMVR